MLRKLFFACGVLTLCVVIAVGVFLNQISRFYLANKEKSPEYSDIIVEEGESFTSVAKRLEEQGIIANAFWFRVYGKLSGRADEVKVGNHTLVVNDSYADNLTRLTEMQTSNEIQVTIPEGYTIKKMGELLAAKGLVTIEEWDAATNVSSPLADHSFVVAAQKPEGVDLEGYLFPDTYRFAVDTTAQEIAEIMLDTMERRVNELGITPTGDAAGMTMHEILTLASIVEREVRQPETMKNVADIFLKRLEIGMALQADSTVNYVTGGDNPSITLEERDNTDSPYNTYKYAGLPPGPISNPGLNAIEAVLHPIENNYYYFLTTDDGKIYYAETHDQHVENKNRYLR